MAKIFGFFFLMVFSFSAVAQKVGKNGQTGGGTTTLVNQNGKANSTNHINIYGKIISPITGNGSLNYQIFTAKSSYANNENNFKTFTNPSDQTSTGSQIGNLLLDWSNYSTLVSAGISIPNGGDSFSVVVSGTFIPEETGTYTFTCEGDDAVDLFINDINVANHYGAHAIYNLGNNTGVISLVAGNNYPFRARMQDGGGGEGLRVFWRKPSQASGWYINTTELSSVTQ